MKTTRDDSSQPKRVLVLVFDGIEEVEALGPIDILRRSNVEVVAASLENRLEITGRNEIRFIADCFLRECELDTFDMLYLLGGPGVIPLAENETVLNTIHAFDREKRFIAAICAAPVVLRAAGVLNDRIATGHLSIRSDLPQPSDERIVQTEHILTSQGAGTAIACGIQMACLLVGNEVADNVSASIHA